jgi:hypothetical protein
VKAPEHFDARWAAELADFCASSYAEYAAMEPGTATQVDAALAADTALDCACVLHPLGAPPHDVRIWIARAAYALGEVFRLRGTSAAVPTVVVTEEGAAQVAAPGGPDYSLTNSRRGLLAMYTALAAGDSELAERTAGLVGDPPGASYLGPDSVVCTPDEQQLAYALKALLLGQIAVAAFQAAVPDSAPPAIRHQATAMQAMVGQNPQLFLDALDALLVTHSLEAADIRHQREPRYFLSLPALGLAALATTSGLVAEPQLPIGYSYFAPQLIRRGADSADAAGSGPCG